LEEQLTEVRGRRLVAERNATAISRHSGLSKDHRKLDKELTRAERQVTKLREREAELQNELAALRTAAETAEVAPSEVADEAGSPDDGESPAHAE
jgi:phage shock protein A